LELGGSWGYNGTVKIDASVSKPTKEIVLNVKEISIVKAEIQAGNCLFELYMIYEGCY
jgi:hypothetical protein